MTSTQTTPRALTIIGPGKVGRSLTRAAAAANLSVELLDRKELQAGDLGHHLVEAQATPELHFVLLAVPDTEIEAACEALCSVAAPPGPVGHLSGATGLEVLAAAENTGVATFSLHPLQTFANGETDVAGIPCAVTSRDERTFRAVIELARRIGLEPFTLAEEDRAIYHAAASIASNFLVCLEQEASELLTDIGIEDARKLLRPLLTQTLSNWSETGAAALTGPIARGDEDTVQRHLEALRQRAPQLVPAYLALAERTRSLAAGDVTGREKKAIRI